jgi:hypothetical protein
MSRGEKKKFWKRKRTKTTGQCSFFSAQSMVHPASELSRRGSNILSFVVLSSHQPTRSSVGRQTGTGSTPACAHMEIKPVLSMLGSGNKIVRADAGLASGRQHIDNPAYCMTSASSHVLNLSASSCANFAFARHFPIPFATSESVGYLASGSGRRQLASKRPQASTPQPGVTGCPRPPLAPRRTP